MDPEQIVAQLIDQMGAPAREALDIAGLDTDSTVTEQPAVWDELTLPGVLATVDETQYVSTIAMGEAINLNAIAIGLGLADISYEPSTFPALIYEPEEDIGAAVAFGSGDVFGVGETPTAAQKPVSMFLDRVSELDLVEDKADTDIEAQQIAREIQ